MKTTMLSLIIFFCIASILYSQERITFEKGSFKIKYLDDYENSVKSDSNVMISEFLVQFHDGTQYNNDYRSQYQYNSIGKVGEILDQTWSGNDWNDDYKISFEYDASGNNILTTYQYNSGTQWQNSSRIIVVCDSNGNPIHKENQTWYNNAWASYLADDNTFDSNSNLVQSITSQYNYSNPNPQWSFSYKSNYTYNQQGQQIVRERYYPIGDSNWYPTFREDIRYNSDGLEQSKYSVVSNDSGMTFNPFQVDTTAYNNHKKRTYYKSLYHDGLRWKDDYLVQSTYTGSLEIEREETIWSRTSNDMSKEKYTFTYNQQDQLIEALEQYWYNNAWENMWHDYYSYNQYGYHSEIESFHWSLSSWRPFIKYIMTYSMVADINNPEKLIKDFVLYQNYPNPFNSTTKIIYIIEKYSNVTLILYNLLGEEIKVLDQGLKLPGKYEVVLEDKSLSSGVYFYEFKTPTKKLSKKMILLK